MSKRPLPDAVIHVDVAKLEARVLAAYGVPSPMDLHKSKAAELFGIPVEKVTEEQRGAGKAVNFGRYYGMGNRAERRWLLERTGTRVSLANRWRYRRTLALRKARKFWDRLLSMLRRAR